MFRPLSGIRAKIGRARKHIGDLDSALRSFYESKPYAVGIYRYANPRKVVHLVTGVQETPQEITFIAGDAIQNLRSTLDHLAVQLNEIGTFQAGCKRVYFPIFDGADKCKTRLDGMEKNSRKEIIDRIRTLQAYKGGHGHELWVLHELNNIDKHRDLLTVGAAYQSVNLGPGPDSWLAKEMKKFVGEGFVFPKLDHFVRPADRKCPLKQGDILLTSIDPDGQFDDNVEFRFEVALAEPDVADGKPLLETLNTLADLVERVVTGFEPFS